MHSATQAQQGILIDQQDASRSEMRTESPHLGAQAGTTGMDAELLAQKLSLVQSSVVATGREMRRRVQMLERNFFEALERRDNQSRDAILQLTSRLEELHSSVQHPQRQSRAARVAFAPRQGVPSTNDMDISSSRRRFSSSSTSDEAQRNSR